MRFAGLFAIVVFAACSHTIDPCPAGSEAYRDEDRCVQVEWNSDDAGSAIEDGGTNPDGGDSGSLDAALLDGSFDAPDARPDADADMPAPDVCSPEDIAAWEAFHLREGVVSTLLECVAHDCEGSACATADCVRNAAQVEGCDPCTYDEALCVLSFCGSACGEPGSDLECRACTCEAGCVTRFEQCALASLDVCEDVHGRDASSEEFALSDVWLVRAKSATGVWHAGPLTPSPPRTEAFPFALHTSKGFTHLKAFRIAERAYVLQHKSRCGEDPCLARIWPFLRDGTLGRPAYAETWTRGWDEVDVFAVSGQHFLLRYKAGHTPSESEPVDTLRVDRLVPSTGSEGLALSRVLVNDAGESGPSAYTWSRLVTFALGGKTYLLRYGSSRDGELQLLRVDLTGDRLTLTKVAQKLKWSRGWDVVEIFQHQGLPYVLTYKSGRLPSTDEPPGSARILGLFAPVQDTLGFTPPLYEGVWESGFTRVLAYEHEGMTHVLRQNATTGMVQRFELPRETSQWSHAFGAPAWTARWGANPVWDLLDVVRPDEGQVTP